MENTNEFNFGIIRTIRKRKGMTLEDVAKKSGYSIARISEVERGANAPIATINTICIALDVSFLYVANLSFANGSSVINDIGGEVNEFLEVQFHKAASKRLFDKLKLVGKWSEEQINELIYYIRVRDCYINKEKKPVRSKND